MKNRIKLFGIIAFIAIAGFALVTCDNGITDDTYIETTVNIPVTGVSLNTSAITILLGETGTLHATVAPANATNRSVTWSSSDPSVATVSASGVVTAVSVGTATITVTTVNGNFTASALVTVSAVAVDVTGVSVAPASFNLDVGGMQLLTATITPSTATNQGVLWSSSNIAIATVTAGGTVTAIAAGTATITVTTDCGGHTATSNVTVNPITVTGVSLKPSTYLVVGSSETLFPSIEPSNAANQGITWSSSNNLVATVTPGGTVTAVGVGTAAITVTTDCGGFTASTNVTVSTLVIPVAGVYLPLATTAIHVDGTYTFTATITPSNATNQNLTWSSGNTAVATVCAGGIVTGVSIGTAAITVITVDGGFSATRNITVNPVLATGVSLNRTATSLEVGNTETLTATVTPHNATDQSVTWSSSNNTVATVSATGVVTAIYPGTATITATSNCGGHTATCVITVISRVTGVTLNMTTASVNVGATQALVATVAPANATNRAVAWSSNNTAVATVSTLGVVTGVSTGNATITVTTVDGGFTATSNVTVTVWAYASAGHGHTLAIRSDGSLWAWGNNNGGRTGLNTNTGYTLVPTRVGNANNWASVSAGNFHSLAVTTCGQLWAWGGNVFGNTGLNTDTGTTPVPTRVGNATNWSSVSAGLFHSIAVTTNGELWAWGANFFGLTGLDTDTGHTLVPTRVGNATNWASVSAGGSHSLARTTNGELWGWGFSNNWQPGPNDNVNTFVPTFIASGWASFSAGNSNNIAITTTGQLFRWGSSTVNFSRIGFESNWASVSSGINSYYLAITTNGQLWAWGNNLSGQLGDGTTTWRHSPVRIR